MPLAKRKTLELSITAFRNRFCKPQLLELDVVEIKNMKFEAKTDTPEIFLVTLQTRTMKTSPDPDLPAVAASDALAGDLAAE